MKTDNANTIGTIPYIRGLAGIPYTTSKTIVKLLNSNIYLKKDIEVMYIF